MLCSSSYRPVSPSVDSSTGFGGSGSASILSGCAQAAGASRGLLRGSRRGCGRVVFVFPSSCSASRFAAVVSGIGWASHVAASGCRGRVVVCRLWASALFGSSFPLA